MNKKSTDELTVMKQNMTHVLVEAAETFVSMAPVSKHCMAIAERYAVFGDRYLNTMIGIDEIVIADANNRFALVVFNPDAMLTGFQTQLTHDLQNGFCRFAIAEFLC